MVIRIPKVSYVCLIPQKPGASPDCNQMSALFSEKKTPFFGRLNSTKHYKCLARGKVRERSRFCFMSPRLNTKQIQEVGQIDRTGGQGPLYRQSLKQHMSHMEFIKEPTNSIDSFIAGVGLPIQQF